MKRLGVLIPPAYLNMDSVYAGSVILVQSLE